MGNNYNLVLYKILRTLENINDGYKTEKIQKILDDAFGWHNTDILPNQEGEYLIITKHAEDVGVIEYCPDLNEFNIYMKVHLENQANISNMKVYWQKTNTRNIGNE